VIEMCILRYARNIVQSFSRGNSFLSFAGGPEGKPPTVQLHQGHRASDFDITCAQPLAKRIALIYKDVMQPYEGAQHVPFTWPCGGPRIAYPSPRNQKSLSSQLSALRPSAFVPRTAYSECEETWLWPR
jgi:hypothetical protein